MDITLTGGTGYIGSAVLARLLAQGHTVGALVRSEEAGAKVEAAGARPLVGDLTDVEFVAEAFASADAGIHTASPGDATSADFDRGIATAAVQAFAGTDKPYVHTSGVWIFGEGDDLTEQSPLAPPALTAWRPDVEAVVLDADLRGSVIAPGIVYGHGAGIATSLLPQDGTVHLVGDGSQHWTTVHVDDLAALYVRVLERGDALGRVLGVGGDNPTVRELGEAAAAASGAEVSAETPDASRERLGALFADALLLDQRASGAYARSLGWAPERASLADELRGGHGG